uniref:Alpha-(1,3)-fucosyltransferase FucT N-terminal domain-containing protein n=1 Tax=viral metagenome TaxID=1070528 RepID=A0A6C0DGY9_9ZZZZ
MPRIGISFRPNADIFYSGFNQTAFLFSELFTTLGYDVVMIDVSNSDGKCTIPKTLPTENLYQVRGLDLLLDMDGLISADDRVKVSKATIVFLRTFVQFTEMDSSVYIETPYVRRSFDHVREIWCWDILNPENTLPSIQTLFPCPLRTVPFIWSSTVAQHFLGEHATTFRKGCQWTVHVAEKNVENTSSSILPLVAIRELCLSRVLDAHYKIHNMEAIKDNKFLKENVLDNIQSEQLPLEMVPKQPFYEWLGGENVILFSHSRFVPLRIGLLNALWMGFPLVHNSLALKGLHPVLGELYYQGNDIRQISAAFSYLNSKPGAVYAASAEIRYTMTETFGIQAKQAAWNERMTAVFSFVPTTVAPITCTPITCTPITCTPITVDPVEKPIVSAPVVSAPVVSSPSRLEKPVHSNDILTVAFSDMWPGFNYDSNFIMDALRHELGSRTIRGMPYDSAVVPHVVIFGPYSESWKSIPSSIPKVYFSAENWALPNDPSIKLYLTSSRTENSSFLRIPTWMTFIDWFSGNTQLPADSSDNPIRLPLHFATTPHPIGFKDRKAFCGFVVSNPICTFRNQVFDVVNQYKRVDSGGALYNNIGGQLSLKYPGGGCGDISKHHFFAEHQFTISFENSQAPGYITEKVLHSKMAGCVPLYWGDSTTDGDFTPNSFINLSNTSDPQTVLAIIKKLESNPDMCARIAATPILDETRVAKAKAIMSNMSGELLRIMGLHSIKGIEKTYVINLDTRPDRWAKLMAAEPYLEPLVERVPGVNGKTLEMNPFVFHLFNQNEFQWKKSIIGCNLSHISVWNRIATAEKEGYYLVLEDDVRFQKDWMSSWKESLKVIPADADLLYLGGVLPPNKAALPLASKRYNEHWSFIQPNTFFSPVPIPVFHFCAYSYILTRAGAQKIIAYLNDSEKKSFTVSDHLLGHPSVGLTKYFADPLLSYCFQEDDPVYVSSQFNDLHREDKFDSDIWNNKECFTEEELAPFRNPITAPTSVLASIPEEVDESAVAAAEAPVVEPVSTETSEKTLRVYHASPEPYQPYEMIWLQDMLQRKIELISLENATIGHNTWFIVQRPHIEKLISIFQQMEEHRIPFHIIHISDEFCSDDLSFYSMSMCKSVLRNYIRPDFNGLPHVHTIPLGYHHKPTSVKSFDERELVWSFHGTDWFERSKQLEGFIDFVPYSCNLQPHWNHPTATREKTYLSLLGSSKFCPILKGQHAETFRLYEALESGTLPLTTITDPVYLEWVDSHMGLSSVYDWTNPVAVLSGPPLSEQVRLEVQKRWFNWKKNVQDICSSMLS